MAQSQWLVCEVGGGGPCGFKNFGTWPVRSLV